MFLKSRDYLSNKKKKLKELYAEQQKNWLSKMSLFGESFWQSRTRSIKRDIIWYVKPEERVNNDKCWLKNIRRYQKREKKEKQCYMLYDVESIIQYFE